MENNLYLVTHSHEHGQSTFIVRCNRFPTDEEVMKYCGIPAETPLESEDLVISSITPSDITEIP